ncbi:MAG: cob(I)yrinic acid a,c-diamide adenosyltransferase [Clostridia bacterium]|nr:cob(I)yrinic acid a,c-diamide adenosyltransferase [Clostridia bacterium]
MKIYTKGGDFGTTTLCGGEQVSKTDERIELLGTIDEVNSHLGLAKAMAADSLKEIISCLQRTLMTVMAGFYDAKNPEFFIKDEQIQALESEIDKLESSFERKKGFVLYGANELSARLDVARAVLRRAERDFCRVSQKCETDKNAQAYINRLSDYLYILARASE